jgi:hypothetical protein
MDGHEACMNLVPTLTGGLDDSLAPELHRGKRR